MTYLVLDLVIVLLTVSGDMIDQIQKEVHDVYSIPTLACAIVHRWLPLLFLPEEDIVYH